MNDEEWVVFLMGRGYCVGGLEKSGFERYDLSGYAADGDPIFKILLNIAITVEYAILKEKSVMIDIVWIQSIFYISVPFIMDI